MLQWIDHVPLASQAKSLIQTALGDKKGAITTHENFVRTYANLIDSNLLFTTCNSHYCSEHKPKITNKNWMKELDGYSLVTTVTMPGTHDSGCMRGGEIAKCQSWTIHDQLDAGIRFFDIRCKNVKNMFHIYHGIINCHLTFDQVIKYCQKFLEENPSEFLVMRIKEEGRSMDATSSFSEIYQEYMKNEIFLKSKSKEINVNQARGKIIVLKSFKEVGTGYEMDFHKDTILQDDFEPASLELKIKEVSKHHKNAKPLRSKFHINFLSACNSKYHAYPRFFAGRCNKVLLDLIQDGQNKYNFGGIIVMDFPGEIMIRHCIELNKPTEYKVLMRSRL